ncbi:hypothetical protein PHYBLDRAFT_66843 [Phycomyces blakesleeanus NRRL 1555(-)]|uniref:Uncharacterized protein n=1 Tax=Phycomyces blakesleeanus (strain ATCC 8743b / DSM 1359 / FGSC 10004 / NBRC 33097 / NRRL 1555) TaxID=763407 RepID=A0A167KYW1_PHYB8|nr:hypothetical protein PHYBLDRAFT_66843 [Phycomyces blakesleeanus NRRL 1555(-)]OAD69189.1 hypothetical protein PHYBLDRAFT_66843 [Phycomyces blakesleeanus NRRL 1555(-)]|eukprot:XP_018287229.1 hypothetical protein PHYBLDRAFT_66843 [Phycomyces blakesleeanus NRRL 1555(-)]
MKASWPRFSYCWLLAFALYLWIFAVSTQAFPVPLSSSTTDNSLYADNQQPPSQQQKFSLQNTEDSNKRVQHESSTEPGEYRVNVSHFSQLLTSHLLFEHLENTYLLVSKKISLFFQDTIQLTAKLPEQLVINSSSSVDVQILKHQLRGAVAAYIEDRVPAMWNMHASALDKTSLQSFIEYTVIRLCQTKDKYDQDEVITSSIIDDDNDDQDDDFTQYNKYLEQQKQQEGHQTTDSEIVLTVSNVCLNANSGLLFSALEGYIGKHIRQAMSDMVSSNNLPHLYSATRAQVKGVLAHFNSYILVSSGVQLELTLSPQDALSISNDYSWLFKTSTVDEILTTVAHWANEDTAGGEEEGEEGEEGVEGDPVKNSSSQNMLLVHSIQTFANIAQYS